MVNHSFIWQLWNEWLNANISKNDSKTDSKSPPFPFNRTNSHLLLIFSRKIVAILFHSYYTLFPYIKFPLCPASNSRFPLDVRSLDKKIRFAVSKLGFRKSFYKLMPKYALRVKKVHALWSRHFSYAGDDEYVYENSSRHFTCIYRLTLRNENFSVLHYCYPRRINNFLWATSSKRIPTPQTPLGISVFNLTRTSTLPTTATLLTTRSPVR